MATHFYGVSPTRSQTHLDKYDSFLGSSEDSTSAVVEEVQWGAGKAVESEKRH